MIYLYDYCMLSYLRMFIIEDHAQSHAFRWPEQLCVPMSYCNQTSAQAIFLLLWLALLISMLVGEPKNRFC